MRKMRKEKYDKDPKKKLKIRINGKWTWNEKQTKKLTKKYAKKEIERTFLVCWSKFLSAEKGFSNFPRALLPCWRNRRVCYTNSKWPLRSSFFSFFMEGAMVFYIEKEQSVLYNLKLKKSNGNIALFSLLRKKRCTVFRKGAKMCQRSKYQSMM